LITRALIAINVLAFIWEWYTGAFHSDQALVNDGVLIPALVLQYHEWWRVITSGFLHANIAHIGINMLSLYWLGRFIEMALRPLKMLIVYFAALIAGGVAVVYFAPPDAATLGASGAIFGLFGALFAIGFKLGERGMELVRANVGILLLNLVFSFTFPGISWQAHIGGLLAGFVATYALFSPPRPVRAPVYDAQTGAEYESRLETPDEQRY
jgi:membrane associated rhomboid family serine protease